MSPPKPAPSILTVLALIQQRPGMYLGWDASERRKQLHGLEMVLLGYRLALHQHGVGSDDLATIEALDQFLRQRSPPSNLTSIGTILSTSSSEEEAWKRVWDLIDEFREQRGHTW